MKKVRVTLILKVSKMHDLKILAGDSVNEANYEPYPSKIQTDNKPRKHKYKTLDTCTAVTRNTKSHYQLTSSIHPFTLALNASCGSSHGSRSPRSSTSTAIFNSHTPRHIPKS